MARFQLNQTLKGMDIFSKLSDGAIATLAMHLEKTKHKNKSWVFQQGEVGDRFYILVEGSAQVIRKASGMVSMDEILADLSVGSVFGERALLTREPRFAGVRCNSAAVTLSINQAGFEKVLGPLSAAVKKQQYEAPMLSAPPPPPRTPSPPGPTPQPKPTSPPLAAPGGVVATTPCQGSVLAKASTATPTAAAAPSGELGGAGGLRKGSSIKWGCIQNKVAEASTANANENAKLLTAAIRRASEGDESMKRPSSDGTTSWKSINHVSMRQRMQDSLGTGSAEDTASPCPWHREDPTRTCLTCRVPLPAFACH